MIIAAVVGYLIGSFPTAQLLGRRSGVDPTLQGDGNPGWWNSRELMGKRRARLVLLGDVMKGVLAALVGAALWGPWWWAYVAIGFAMIGHAFPVFAGFKGGRSVLTFVGGVLVVATVPTVLALLAGLVYGAISFSLAKGARVAMASFPLIALFFEPRAEVATAGLLMTFIGLRFLFARSPAPATSAPATTSPA